MFKKDDCVTLTIEDIGTDGAGIGKADGYTLFVKDAVIGDVIRAKIMKAKKNYGYARLMEIITPSKERVEPRCPVARQCGGCQIQQMSYEAQLKYKRRLVKDNLLRIGGIDCEVLPVIGMDEPFHYRNKAQYPVGRSRDGRVIIGFYAGRTHSIVDYTDCCIGAVENKAILEQIREFIEENNISVYDESSHSGLVRHILIRTGYHTGQIMVCLIINGNSLPAADKLVKRLSALPGMTSVMLNINREKTNVILGSKCVTLWGKSYIEDSICRIMFRISPLSFFQVNPRQTEKLYLKALEYAGLTGKETVWDLYCGIGTISLLMSTKARRVYGVEIVPQAIEDAKNNASLNSITNAEFFVGRAEEVVPKMYEQDAKAAASCDREGKTAELTAGGGNNGSSRISAVIQNASDERELNVADAAAQTEAERRLHPEVVVVDPPRKGCDETLLDTIVKMSPERIVYVSCDSATLARDLKYLTANGYEVKKVQPVDQFGHTVHVETVCLLSQRKPDTTIEVDLDISELEVSSAETKATYEEIKSYVLKKFGLKVSNFYIAQVKRECGIVERINYNLPKTEGNRVPQCPEDKRKAIKDAFIHFQMI